MINNYTNIISAATSSLSNLDEQHPCDPANNVALQELIGDITEKIDECLESDFPPPTIKSSGEVFQWLKRFFTFFS